MTTNRYIRNTTSTNNQLNEPVRKQDRVCVLLKVNIDLAKSVCVFLATARTMRIRDPVISTIYPILFSVKEFRKRVTPKLLRVQAIISRHVSRPFRINAYTRYARFSVDESVCSMQKVFVFVVHAPCPTERTDATRRSE